MSFRGVHQEIDPDDLDLGLTDHGGRYMNTYNYKSVDEIPVGNGTSIWLTGVHSNQELIPLSQRFDLIVSMGFWDECALSCPRIIVPIEDDDYQADVLKEMLLKLIPDLHQWLQGGKKVLVHCRAGVSRSPTAVIFYLIWLQNGGSLIDYVVHLKEHRSCVAPNLGFLHMLQRYLKE